MNEIRRIDRDTFARDLERSRRPYHDQYLAMYSSHLGGITTDPLLMLVPADDHVVHRGDGVFETMKGVQGAVYNLSAHMARLERSAQRIRLPLPVPLDQIRQIVLETARVGGQADNLIRVLVTRGPGSLSCDPADCPESQLYVVVAQLRPPFMTQHPEGARIGFSRTPLKPPIFATAKTCNYLPNAMMYLEAHDQKVDFVINSDSKGFLGECASENIAIISEDNEFQTPLLNSILAGTTLERVMTLAKDLVRDGALEAVRFAGLQKDDLLSAREIFIIGTTRNVTAVVQMDGRPVGDGKPGPLFQTLSRLLLDDIVSNPALRTPFQA